MQLNANLPRHIAADAAEKLPQPFGGKVSCKINNGLLSGAVSIRNIAIAADTRYRLLILHFVFLPTIKIHQRSRLFKNFLFLYFLIT